MKKAKSVLKQLRQVIKRAAPKAAEPFRFPVDKPFPFALIGKTVKALVQQRDADNAD